MSLDYIEEDRQVIPRWRDFTTTFNIGELDSIARATKTSVSIPEELWKNKLQEWRDNPVAIFASDLLSSAIALGRSSEALEAAECILKSGTLGADTAKQVAQNTIVTVAALTQPEFHLKHHKSEDLFPQIRELRKLLRQEPRDAFGWCDLALLHEVLGQGSKAEKAMRIALSLAPENRFILRSAARLYLHQEELDQACYVLSKSQAVRNDPWVLAAEIAVTSACGRVSGNIKKAKRILVAERDAPRHLSELQSAIATVDLQSGSIRHAKREFRKSLIDPTENALAQAKWASRRIGHLDVDSQLIEKIPLSHEARAWDYFTNSKWKLALQESWKWFRDQPFSSRPPLHGSFIATTVLEEYEEAARIARCGLIGNPNNFLLRNNLAVALARDGKIEEARNEFARIQESQLDDVERITWLASSGLIAIRSGDSEQGRMFYLNAIKHATAAREERLRIMALLNLAIESITANLQQAEDDRRESLKGTELIKDPVIGVLVEQLKSS